MAKINFNTMNKTQLGDILVSNLSSIKNTAKNGKLKDRVLYAGKHDSTKSDLLSLVKEVATYLGESLVVPAVAEEKKESNKPKLSMSKKGSTKSENLTKAQKPAAKKADEKSETPKTPKKESTKSEKPKAETPKKDTKKDTKKSVSEVLASRNGVVLLEQFPDTIEFDGNEYEKAEDITSMKKLHKAIEGQRDIVVAFYFPRRNLKQFGYFNNIMGKITEFKNDLDFCQPLYVSEEDKVAYLISLYTEAVFYILPEDFTPVDGVKIAGAIEFEIYEAK